MRVLCRYIVVEDTYGVGFHKKILNKLYSSNLISCRDFIVKRIDPGPCNHAFIRKLKGHALRKGCNKVQTLFVIDVESTYKREESDILNHFKHGNKSPIKLFNPYIVLVNPNHEKWLCIGLLGNLRRCKNNFRHIFRQSFQREYKKMYLDTMAEKVEIRNLVKDKDFSRYLSILRKMCKEKSY